LSCRQLEQGRQTEKARRSREDRRSTLPFDRPAMASAITDECGDHLHPSGVDALQSGDVERYGLRFLEEAGETLFQGERVGHRALGRQRECARCRLFPGCHHAVARADTFGAI
jgi:hypothetical protein